MSLSFQQEGGGTDTLPVHQSIRKAQEYPHTPTNESEDLYIHKKQLASVWLYAIRAINQCVYGYDNTLK